MWVITCCAPFLSSPLWQKRRHRARHPVRKLKAKKRATWKRRRRKRRLTLHQQRTRKRRAKKMQSKTQRSKKRNQVQTAEKKLDKSVRWSPCKRKFKCFSLQKQKKRARKRKRHPQQQKPQTPRIRPRWQTWRKVRLTVFDAVPLGKHIFFYQTISLQLLSITEEVKGEKDAGKEVKAAKEEAPKGNGKPPTERPRFMFNIADGGFTGQ